MLGEPSCDFRQESGSGVAVAVSGGDKLLSPDSGLKVAVMFLSETSLGQRNPTWSTGVKLGQRASPTVSRLNLGQQ